MNKNNIVNQDEVLSSEVLNKDLIFTPEELENLKKGLEELKEISKELNNSELNDGSKMDISSFDESFPNFHEKIKEKDIIGIFDDIKILSDKLEDSEILNKILEERGLVGILKMFNKNPEFDPKEALVLLKKNMEENIKNMENKPLGEFGETTINEVFNQGLKIIKPLRESLDKIGLDINTGGKILTFLFMFNSICKSHASLLRSYNPYKEYYEKMSAGEKLNLEKLWINSNTRFRLIAAPLLVTSLYVIKNTILTHSVAPIESKPDVELPNNSITLLAFLKKLPNFIGKLVIIIFIINLIKYLLESYSINLMDSFYIKIFCILGIVVISILSLDYLLKFLIYLYFRKNKNLTISKKLPKIVYEYLNSLKIVSGMEYSYYGFFLINFVVYLIILLLLIIIFIK